MQGNAVLSPSGGHRMYDTVRLRKQVFQTHVFVFKFMRVYIKEVTDNIFVISLIYFIICTSFLYGTSNIFLWKSTQAY